MRKLISGLVLTLVHIGARLLFRVRSHWVGNWTGDPWRCLKESDVRVMLFLNHTSLYEPIFAGALPIHFIWFMAGRLLVPGADKTLKRPLVGTFYKLLTPATIPITRKRDGTWTGFLSMISRDTLVMLAPEGRMKRRGGLDAKGQPMSVRGGIADVLEVISEGKMVFCYSQGLHHIQAPGEWFPRLFRTAEMAFEAVDIAEYKRQMETKGEPFKLAVVHDLESRIQKHCAA